MHEPGHFFGQRLLRFTLMRLGLYLFFQRCNFLPGQEGEVFEVFHHITVIAVSPELVELVGGGFLWIKPDRAACAFAEFGAVRFEHQRDGQAEHLGVRPFFFTDQVQSACDIAPLVRAADLQLHILMLVQVQVVQ
ncbi:hypothetical protein D3C75_934030 [compost metagenome]